MVDPVGLTRAEEEALQQVGPRVVVRAPPGAPACRVAVPPDGGDCPAAATRRIVWPSRDGWDRPTLACRDCAERMQQVAASHNTTLRVEPLG
jgi:hypothetical protein